MADTESVNTNRSHNQKVRRDAYGNPITTIIGSYSKSKPNKRGDDAKAGDDGGASGEGPRHKISFADHIHGDESKL